MTTRALASLGITSIIATAGWAYAAAPHAGSGESVVRDVAVGLVAVAGVATIAAVGDALEQQGRHGGAAAAVTRVATDVAVELADEAIERAFQPRRSDEAESPHDGDSRMYLEMTLIDNRTGVALWHAHQQFPGDVAHRDDVDRAARTLLASLPARPSR